MQDWSQGYVADIGYTFGYYPELDPGRVRLALLAKGLVPPPIEQACELGFGQGLSINVHAAGAVEWWGTDFNPSQAGLAQSLQQASGAPAKLSDDSFAEFCQRSDLPDFDFIGLHGIWSWISDENRRCLVDFFKRKLKVGGVLYVSYNTMPGWAHLLPLRHLLVEHAERLSSPGTSRSVRIDQALAFAQRLMKTEPAYAKANPQVGPRLERMMGMSRPYLAHEYFNRDWHPMPFSDMVDWLGPAKLEYGCSAALHDHVDGFHLTEAQTSLLNEIADSHFRETVRDQMVNQTFRRDYWVRGPRRLAPDQRRKMLGQFSVALTSLPESVSLKISTTRGEISLAEQVYGPIVKALDQRKGCNLHDLSQAVAAEGVGFEDMVQAVVVLCGSGFVTPALLPAQHQRAKPHCQRLNSHLLQLAHSSADIAHLASPVTGTGIHVGRIQQLFLAAYRQGLKSTAEQAQFGWSALKSAKQRLVVEGKTLESDAENLAELERMASRTHAGVWALWERLELIEG